MSGKSPDEPLTVNVKQPLPTFTVITETGQKMQVDGHKFAEAANRIGADKYDVMSIGGYRDAKGEFVPDYDTVRIERRNVPET